MLQIKKFDIVTNDAESGLGTYFVTGTRFVYDETVIEISGLELNFEFLNAINSFCYSKLSNINKSECIHHDSFKDMITNLDEYLNYYKIEPIIYTLYDNKLGHTVIGLMLCNNVSNVVVDVISETFANLIFKDIKLLASGKHSDNFRIINEYDTFLEALNSPEMMNYNDVLNSI